MRINDQGGVSITELLLSLSLSCLLMTALLQHYTGIKRHYVAVQRQLDQYFELQLACELIRDSVRQAGFAPCIGINRLQTRDSRNEAFPLTAITIKEGTSHAVKFARMSDRFAVVLKQLSPTRLLLKGNRIFDRKYPILVADCFHAEVLQISSSMITAMGQVVTLKKPMIFDYHPPVYFGEWLEERFLIGKNGQGLPALFYEANDREELTSHINQLTARLIPLNGNTLLQVTLGIVGDKPVRLETTVRTPQRVITGETGYA